MAHPFFDANAFPWTRREAKQLFEQLAVLITEPDEIKVLFVGAGGPPGDLVTAPNRVMWQRALDLLAAGRCLEALCDQLRGVARLRKNADYHAAIEAVANAQELIDRRVFAPSVLVLDRAPLREALKQLAPAHVPLRVILVRGPEKSGKTWAQHVFQAAALDHGAQPFFVYGGMVADAHDLVDELFASLGAPAPGDFDTTENAAYGAVCRELMRAVVERKQPLWIAIDDVRDFDDTVREFCDQLGARMRMPSYAEWFRLMLIHYPERTLPTTWRPEIWTEDVTTSDDIQQADVEAVLAEWAAGSLHEDAIRQMAADVMTQVDAADSARLQALHDSVAKVIQAKP